MTVDTLSLSAHFSDGDILRFADGECDLAERSRIASHLTECAHCAATASFFDAASKQVAASLDDLAVQPAVGAKARFFTALRQQADAVRRPPIRLNAFERPRVRRNPLLRAAIVIFGLAGVAMTASPVRAWFVELLRPVVTRSPATPVTANEPVPAVARTSSTVSFPLNSPRFVVAIAARQTDGTLTLRVGDGDLASARVTGRDRDDALLVTDSGLQIRNASQSTATYEVTVPASVQSVTVVFGDGERLFYTMTRIATEDSVVINLSDSRF